jgi:hypothetical protein
MRVDRLCHAWQPKDEAGAQLGNMTIAAAVRSFLLFWRGIPS